MEKIFISYAREDIEKAQSIFLNLKKEGLNPWMDKPPKPYELNGLLPGEFWKDRLTKEIGESKFIIALLSNNSITKRGYVQREFKLALDMMNNLPQGEEFLIPLLLDECEVPNLKIGFVSLNELNWHDLKNGGMTPIILKLKRNLNKYQQDLLSNSSIIRKPISGLNTRLIDFSRKTTNDNNNSRVKWRTFIGKQKWKNNPIIYKTQVIVGSAGKAWNTGDDFDGVYSLDINSGEIIWKVDTLSDANETNIYNEDVYVGSDAGEILSIEAKSGKVNWCRVYDGEFHTKIETIIQPNKKHHDLIAFDFFGNILLLDSLTSEVLDSVRIIDNFRSSAIKLDKNLLVIVTEKGTVCFLEVKENKINFWKRLSLDAVVFSEPIMNGTNLILGLCYSGGKIPIISVDLKTGKKNWHASETNSSMGNIRANLKEYKNHIWIGGAYSNKLFGIEIPTGKVKFEIDAGAESFPAWSAPAFKDNLIFLPRNDGYLHVIDINKKQEIDSIDLKVDLASPQFEYGKEKYKLLFENLTHKWENYFYSTPLIHGNFLFVGTDEGYFFSIDISEYLNIPSINKNSNHVK